MCTNQTAAAAAAAATLPHSDESHAAAQRLTKNNPEKKVANPVQFVILFNSERRGIIQNGASGNLFLEEAYHLSQKLRTKTLLLMYNRMGQTGGSFSL